MSIIIKLVKKKNQWQREKSEKEPEENNLVWKF